SSPARPVGRPGTLLGLLDTVEVADVEEALAPGEAVVFFTDGVTEARGAEGFFGEERLAGLLDTFHDAGAAGIARGVVGRVVKFQAGNPRDDIAVVVVRVPPDR
ncbi:MAG: SpoIIE family protein phosphatase, partial [Actinomycetes bacterium]